MKLSYALVPRLANHGVFIRLCGSFLAYMVLLQVPAWTLGQSATITVTPSTTYQTMVGWEAVAQAGQIDSPYFDTYKDALFDQAVNDLGISRLRLEIKNNPSTSTAFNLTRFDDQITRLAVPMRQRSQARGETLWLNVCYVAFDDFAEVYRSNHTAYANQVVATYQHLQSTFGFVPDSWEMMLEPDNQQGHEWTGTELGNLMIATGNALTAAGFTPRLVAASTTSGPNCIPYFDDIKNVLQPAGKMGYFFEISYHRYVNVDNNTLAQIGQRGLDNNVKTAMLEWIGADYNTLHQDLKFARNSSWEQYCLAYPGASDNGGSYYQVSSAGPTFTIGSRTKFLRQYFKYVRKDALRIDATTNNTTFDPLSFKNADNKHVVVIKATAASGANGLTVSGLPAGTYGIFYTTASVYDVNRLDQVIAAGQSIVTDIPAAGVLTVYNKPASSSAGSFQFFAGAYSVNENAGTATITVARSGGATGAVSVQYATSNGTATAGSDYTATTGTLNWADGDPVNKTFTVSIIDDSLAESGETVNLTLSNPTGGATLGGQSSVVLTIIDDETVPATPGNLAATAGNQQVSLTWDGASGAASYTVKRSLTSGGTYASIATGVTTTSYTNPGLTNGVTYYFVVCGVNATGESANSAQVFAAPSAGFAVNLDGSDDFVNVPDSSYGNVNWSMEAWMKTSATDAYIIGNSEGSDLRLSGGKALFTWYTGSFNNLWSNGTINNNAWRHVVAVRSGTQMTVYVDGSSAGSMTIIGSGGNAGFQALGQRDDGRGGPLAGQLDEVRIYTKALTAEVATHYNSGNGQSGSPEANLVAGWHFDEGAGTSVTDYSGNSKTGTLVNGPTWVAGKVGAGAPPAAPANLTATAGDTQVALAWSASSGATSYTVKRSLTSGGTYASIQSGITATSHTNTGLTNGIPYHFVVAAVNGNGESPDSAQVSATPGAPPAATTGFTATPGDTQVALSWSASATATSYNIKRSLTSGISYSTIRTGQTTTNFTDGGLTNDTPYYYVVSAVNAFGESSNSSEASGIPFAYPRVMVPVYDYSTANHTLSLSFSKDVSASLTAADVQVQNLTTPSATVTVTLSSYNPATNTAVFALSPTPLPDGNYRATLTATGVTDPQGHVLDGDGNGTAGDDYTCNFFFLRGDANHDQHVDITDLGMVAANWKQTGKTWAQGDFTYDGKVDINDLGLVAANWKTQKLLGP